MQFDATLYLSLAEAFERTGQAIFPKEWTGLESTTRPTESIADANAERSRLLAERASISRERLELAKLNTSDAPEDQQQAISDEYGELSAQVRRVEAELARLPTISASQLRDAENFARRDRIEGMLKDAFEAGMLCLYVRHYAVLDWKHWSRLPGFQLNFDLSLVRMPRDICASGGHAPVYLLKTEFQAWLAQYTDRPADNSDTYALTCGWLHELIRTDPAKSRTKPEYLEAAKRAVPGLTKRMFEMAWANTVPSDWKTPHRKRRGH